MLVVPMTRLQAELDATLSALGSLFMGLFTANVVPDLSTVIGDVTAGAPSWCAPVAMTGITPAAAAPPVAAVGWDDITFLNTSGSPADVYGYFVTDGGSTILYWAERNGSAPIAVADGQSYTVRPFYSRGNQT